MSKVDIIEYLMSKQVHNFDSKMDFFKFFGEAPKKYKRYEIPKRTSGTRTIAQPVRELKDYQRALIDLFQGYFPVQIDALPEGTVIPTRIPLVQVCTLDPELAWLESFIETALLRAIWYPTTVATLSREAKKIIKHRLEQTGDVANLPFKFHDFGARGASSQETAMIGGSAHLVNFMGTDTFEAVVNISERYDDEGVAGYSIPATEHSISTAYGPDREFEYAEKVVTLIENGAPLAAVVGDTYDLFNFIENILGGRLKERIQNLKGTLVVRPDSGDPIEVTLKTVELLGKVFGYTMNEKGFRVLPSFIRMIQGDGITLGMMDRILFTFYIHGWSADNIAFGIGGGLLQSLNRDSLKFAQKANEAYFPEGGRPIWKDPVTDPGKTSKKGWQSVYEFEDAIISTPVDDLRTLGKTTMLKTVYRWGHPHKDTADTLWPNILNATDPIFANVRARAEVK